MMSDENTVVLERAAGALIVLLGEQSELYGQLAALSETQRGLITGNEPERLLGLLGERQKLLDRLEELAARMRPYQKTWPRMRPLVSPAEVQEVDRLLAKVNGLLATIIEQDKADSQLLAARKSVTGQEMSSLKASRTAGAAYMATAYEASPQREWTDR